MKYIWQGRRRKKIGSLKKKKEKKTIRIGFSSWNANNIVQRSVKIFGRFEREGKIDSEKVNSISNAKEKYRKIALNLHTGTHTVPKPATIFISFVDTFNINSTKLKISRTNQLALLIN